MNSNRDRGGKSRISSVSDGEKIIQGGNSAKETIECERTGLIFKHWQLVVQRMPRPVANLYLYEMADRTLICIVFATATFRAVLFWSKCQRLLRQCAGKQNP